jgi:hypothetical protein
MKKEVSAIIISPKPNMSGEELIRQLNLGDLTRFKDWPTSKPLKLEPNFFLDDVYIADCSNCLILCHSRWPLYFFRERPFDLRQKLVELFPESELTALFISPEFMLWGYSVFNSGKKIRMKVGNAGGTYIDFGEPLEEEKALLEKLCLMEDGRRVYDVNWEALSEFEAAYLFIADIFHRYITKEEFAGAVYQRYQYKNIKRNDELCAHWKDIWIMGRNILRICGKLKRISFFSYTQDVELLKGV